MLDTAHAELTYWLRPQKTHVERLPDYREGTVARREGFIPRFPDIPYKIAAPSDEILERGENPVSPYRLGSRE